MKPWCWWNLLSFMSPPLWHGTEMKTLRCTALLPGGEMRRMWWKFVYLYTASGFYIHFFLSQSKYTSANQSCGENKEAAWHHSKGKTNQTNTTWHHHHQSRSEMMAALLHRTHIWGLVCVCVCLPGFAARSAVSVSGSLECRPRWWMTSWGNVWNETESVVMHERWKFMTVQLWFVWNGSQEKASSL